MTRAPSFAGVILAAGESARMGREKALLPWPPAAPGQAASHETFLSAAIRSLLQAADLVVVVVGKNEPVLAPAIYAQGASLVVNPDAGRGQFSSLQIGLRAVLNYGRDAAIVTLVDRPPISSEAMRLLRAAFEAADENVWAVVPEFSGKHGHPFLLGREMMEAFLRVPVTSTARDVEHQNQNHIRYVPVNEAFVAVNINTPEDYANLPAGGKGS